jgi:hypothetical protein
MIRALDILLQDWGAWCRQLHRSCLSYPARTAESRAGEGRAPGATRTLVPDVMVPERLLGLDRAIRDMPATLKTAIHVRYLEDLGQEEQELLWRERAKQGRRQYYTRLECAHWWLAGRLGAKRDDGST